MNSKIIITALLSISLTACAQESHKVKHKNTAISKKDVKPVKFANAVDPICNMPTEPDMKHTVVYKNKTYGFCSAYCKKEFEKNPEKYVKK